MLRNILKQEIDQLSENQLIKIAKFIDVIKTQPQQLEKTDPHWQQVSPLERAKDFREWITQLPQTNVSLTDEDFDRSSIYK